MKIHVQEVSVQTFSHQTGSVLWCWCLLERFSLPFDLFVRNTGLDPSLRLQSCFDSLWFNEDSKRPRFQVHVDMCFLSWSKQRSENEYTLFIKGWTWLATIFRCLNDALLTLRGPKGANKSPPTHTHHYTTTPVVYTKFWSYNLNVATQIKTHQIKQCPVSPPKLRP